MTDLEREILQQDELAIRNHLELILRAKENGASQRTIDTMISLVTYEKTDMTNEKQNGVQVENEELVKQIQAGINVSSNLEQLYLKNRPFIYNTAMKYSKQAEIDDLMQEGYLGLQKATSMYNSDSDAKFITYAGYWIRQSIQRYCENCGNVKRIPVHLLSKLHSTNAFSTVPK